MTHSGEPKEVEWAEQPKKMLAKIDGTEKVETFVETAARLLSEFAEEVDETKTELSQIEKPVIDDKEASKLAGLIVTAEEELARTKEAGKQKVARCQERVTALRFCFEAKLREYAERRIKGGKKKSVVLDAAKLAFRTIPDKVVTEGPDTLAQWAEVNLPEAVVLVPKVITEEVEKWEAKQGKLAPGRLSQPGEERFYIQTP